VELSLPEGAVCAEGDRVRRCALEPALAGEERFVVRVPEEGHRLIGVAVAMEGGHAEAFVELGEPPAAPDRGLRTRTSPDGGRVLRLGPEELPR
ncbi:MAG: hypothetical protein ACRD2T_13550, partial [Thermoanaerobaculia bacterium]